MAIANSTRKTARDSDPGAASSPSVPADTDHNCHLANVSSRICPDVGNSPKVLRLARAPVAAPYRHDGPDVARCLGAVLAGRRESLGLAAAQVAYRAWIHTSYLHALERGDRQPSMAVFIMLARSLGLDPRELLDGVLEKMRYGRGAPPIFQDC